MSKKEDQDVIRKLKVLAQVKETRNISKTCRY